MIANDLGDQCKSKATSGRFSCNEWVKQVGHYFVRDAGTVVTNAKFQRQTDRGLDARNLQPHARPKRSRQFDVAIVLSSPIASAAFLTRFRNIMNELVPVAEHRRKRGIVVFVNRI